MKLSTSTRTSPPSRIHEIVPDFRREYFRQFPSWLLGDTDKKPYLASGDHG
jgi:hypothetical protein